MATNLFQDATKSLPMKADSQIVRVDMEQMDIGGRKSHLPSGSPKSPELSIRHVPNATSK